MIILDTNVVSALMRRVAEGVVVKWFDSQPADTLWLTALTILEIEMGLNLMASGKKRRQLSEAFAQIHREDLKGRILSFDEPAALCAAKFASLRRSAGRPVGLADVQIAGITGARSATLATRNVKDFEGLSIDIVNPWAP